MCKPMDIVLHYQEQGSGTPLVLLHGNGENGTYFRHQIGYFASQYRVIAIDTRGHGQSPRGSAPFTMEQFCRDVSALLDSLAIPRAILLGFSDGANIAMKFGLAYPQRVIALLLNGGNLNTKGVKPHIQLPIELGYRFAKLFAGKSPEAKRNAEILGLMVNEPNLTPEDLHKITAPALVIAGEKDMIKEKHTRQIAAALPNAKLVIIPGDHFIAAKQPDRFNQETEAFLRTAVPD